jgi:hypothetical protein
MRLRLHVEGIKVVLNRLIELQRNDSSSGRERMAAPEPTDEQLLAVALSAARLAGAVIRRAAGAAVATEEKGGQSDLVTASDRECQEQCVPDQCGRANAASDMGVPMVLASEV